MESKGGVRMDLEIITSDSKIIVRFSTDIKEERELVLNKGRKLRKVLSNVLPPEFGISVAKPVSVGNFYFYIFEVDCPPGKLKQGEEIVRQKVRE